VSPFVDRLARELGTYENVEVRGIAAIGESADAKDRPSEHLHLQQQQAYQYLEPNQPGNVTCPLSLHTDSGAASTSGEYFDLSGSVSEHLGGVLAVLLEGFFGAKAKRVDFGRENYIFTTELHHRHCALLLELGSHQNAGDVARLPNHGNELAQALAAGIVDFFVRNFGLVAPRTANVSPERDYFHDWAKAVHQNDPGGLDSEYAPGKFRAHLQGVGKPVDTGHPLAYYGAPADLK
jgi:hypothetical protein